MKERWLAFVENCKDAVREIAPVFGFLALLFAGIFLVAFIADKSEEEKNKPTPKPTAAAEVITVATPEPTPFPAISPEEIAEEEEERALWEEEALEFARENLPQDYNGLVFRFCELLDYCFDLEETITELEEELERGY